MIRQAANTLVTGGVLAGAAFASSHLQLFAQTVIGNVTPLMIMAAFGWFLRVFRGARSNYSELCDKVDHLEEVVMRLEKRLARRWWHHG